MIKKLENMVGNYDIGIYLDVIDGKEQWYWDISGGYSSCGSSDYFDTPNEARENLMKFLKTFKGFEK